MTAVAIRAMWTALRLILLAVLGGLSLAAWALLAIGVIGILPGGLL